MESEAAFRPIPVKLIVGVFLALLGVILTLDNLYVIDGYPILRFWSVGLVVAGAAIWANGNAWGGGAWMFVGLWLLAYNLELIAWDLFDLWPVALILVGLVMLRQSFDPASRGKSDSESVVSSFTALFGSVRANRSQSFSGGTVTTMVGSSRIDLRDAEIAGDSAVLYTYAFMGGIEILVPEHWEILGRVVPIMAGFDDRTRFVPRDGATKRLVVRGLVLMGGIDVRNRRMGESAND